MRIGFGHDVHAFVSGRPLVIGGVRIPFDRGLAGHSDADVLIHAIIDALLGAAGLGDIGRHFPDNDPQYYNMDSSVLLAKTIDKLSDAGYVVGNVDASICLQRPLVSHYIPEMQRLLAGIMRIDTGRLSVKATTTEHLGFVGREEGAAAYAVALILPSAS